MNKETFWSLFWAMTFLFILCLVAFLTYHDKIETPYEKCVEACPETVRSNAIESRVLCLDNCIKIVELDCDANKVVSSK